MLKEHESKYEPLGHDETFHIMEEILAMQIGLGDDTVNYSIISMNKQNKTKITSAYMYLKTPLKVSHGH